MLECNADCLAASWNRFKRDMQPWFAFTIRFESFFQLSVAALLCSSSVDSRPFQDRFGTKLRQEG